MLYCFYTIHVHACDRQTDRQTADDDDNADGPPRDMAQPEGHT